MDVPRYIPINPSRLSLKGELHFRVSSVDPEEIVSFAADFNASVMPYGDRYDIVMFG